MIMREHSKFLWIPLWILHLHHGCYMPQGLVMDDIGALFLKSYKLLTATLHLNNQNPQMNWSLASGHYLSNIGIFYSLLLLGTGQGWWNGRYLKFLYLLRFWTGVCPSCGRVWLMIKWIELVCPILSHTYLYATYIRLSICYLSGKNKFHSTEAATGGVL